MALLSTPNEQGEHHLMNINRISGRISASIGKRVTKRRALTVGSLLAGFALAAIPATAVFAQASVGDPHGKNCVMELASKGHKATTPVCFDTSSEASAYATGLGVGGSGNSASSSLVWLGSVFYNINYGGQQLALYGATTCKGVTYGWSSLPSGWNNNISSAYGEGNCWLSLYPETSFGGNSMICAPDCSYDYDLNDKVKSLVFRPVGQYA